MLKGMKSDKNKEEAIVLEDSFNEEVEQEQVDADEALMEKPFDPTKINIETKTPSLDTLIGYVPLPRECVFPVFHISSQNTSTKESTGSGFIVRVYTIGANSNSTVISPSTIRVSVLVVYPVLEAL